MRPRTHHIVGDFLVVIWDDGHESYYPAEELRRACPCAYCSGEPDLFGRVSRPAEQNYSPAAFRLGSVDVIGNYALQPNWADGHSHGLWTHDRLRALCPCDECLTRRE
jgi:DUF971 family protein